MKTIRVNIISHECGAVYAIDRDVIATISQNGRGAYSARYGAHACGDGMTFANATQFLTATINNAFSTQGAKVEFINA